MAEKKAVGHAYNIDFLNVVFAASSIFLFLSTIWMVWDDFDREWKNTQRQFTQLELEVTRQQLAQNARGIDKAKLTGLQQQLAAAQKAMDGNRERIDDDQRAARGSRPRACSARTRRRSSPRRPTTSTATRSKTQRKKNPEGVAEQQKEIEAEAQRIARAEPRSAEDRGRARGAAGRARKVHRRTSAGCRRRSTSSTSSRTACKRVVANIEPSFIKDYFRNAPLLDFMAPTLTVRQVVTPERRRRRELRARDEDGSMHDVPSGHRSARLREVSAAVPHAPEPVGVCRQRLAASAGDDRLHGVPSGARRFDQLQRRVALSEQREAARRSGKRSTTGTSRTCGTTRCCRRT